MQDDFDFLKVLQNVTNEEISNRQLDVKTMRDGIRLADEISKDLSKLRQEYSVQAMGEISKSLYVKIQTLIREEKVRKLYAQKQALEDSKVTVLEGIFGKRKLKSEQIRFIELQIKSLTDQPIGKKDVYTAKDSLAEMRAFILLNGSTKEMEELEKNIYQIFGGFTREKVEELAKSKNSQRAELPILVQENNGLFQIRKSAKQLRQQNDIVEQEVYTNIATANSKENMQNIKDKQDAIIIFKDKLKVIANVIKDRNEMQIAKQEFELSGQDTAKIW